MATSLANLGEAEFGAGELDAARDAFAESKALFEAIDDTSRAAQVEVRLARIDLQDNDLVSAQEGVDNVIALAMREALHEPAIEAMELDGDIANQRGDTDRAIDVYQKTIRRIDETGFAVNRNRVATKLANLLLDRNDLEAAEPLVGNLIESGESANALRVRARFAHLQGDTARAAELMESLKSMFAEDWTEADASTLDRYRHDLERTSH
jgi:tetratricopeptide (TPR) repeat protein